MKIQELRIGNQFLYQKNKSVSEGTVTSLSRDKIVFDHTDVFKVKSGDIIPIALTETNIMKIRCQYLENHSRMEFSCSPPGERQVENNYWSREVQDFARLHLSPSYRYDIVAGVSIKRKIPEFWFIWIEACGTGSDRFMPLMEIDKYPLKYFHQLQNLYYDLTGKSLFMSQAQN